MPAPLLNDAMVAFIEREVAMDLAASSAALRPSTARGYGARVSSDRRRVSVFIKRTDARQLLQDVLTQDRVAVTICLPETESAMQLKGWQITLSATTPAEFAESRLHCQRFTNGIAALGFDRVFTDAYSQCDIGDMVTLGFTPEVVFEQTPGPRAGQSFDRTDAV